ncbi:hypothetical protein JX265_000387 [Neoarthrinium moseri]|uniref:Hemerythrin-like domain-containing protein n=1 Tax=Neoarthrinium moseri TaxID=1658444 RepID=A0A9P9WYF8_9PEZI|nr:uncharacterized protein JN550_000637 [Neoarthrinium moseri]KAI1851379.1 hypothetical protein JX266_003454 [Neoarthrinium moseri]KAI1878455.1 hypothetical protein JN550_000637 [Neoarthrinium moseri]KAI1881561.1 hypothetical protein JX265_000387 [Neoarthrinium moseri]
MSTSAEAMPAGEPSQATPTSSTDKTTTTAAAASTAQDEPQAKLPPLSAADFRVYNHMADHMEVYHTHFRATWNLLWNACATGKRPGGMSLRAFVGEGLQFVRHLTLHHNIEEAHIFPVLARRMPEFKAGKGNGAAELLRQHRQIHTGLDALQAYLTEVRDRGRELELPVLKAVLEPWGEVLWAHLDQEVKTLGAENMRRYWTLAEMREMPM